MAAPFRNTNEKFWASVDRRGPKDCWPWLKATKNGYGRFSARGVEIYAHRHAYSLSNGAPPSGREMHVMHLCNNKVCCNPSHLALGTAEENMLAAVRDGLRLVGDEHPSCTIPDETLLKILADDRPQRALSESYGVSQSYISRIKRRTVNRRIISNG